MVLSAYKCLQVGQKFSINSTASFASAVSVDVGKFEARLNRCGGYQQVVDLLREIFIAQQFDPAKQLSQIGQAVELVSVNIREVWQGFDHDQAILDADNLISIMVYAVVQLQCH